MDNRSLDHDEASAFGSIWRGRLRSNGRFGNDYDKSKRDCLDAGRTRNHERASRRGLWAGPLRSRWGVRSCHHFHRWPDSGATKFGHTSPTHCIPSPASEIVAVGKRGTILTASDGSNWVVQTSGTFATFVGAGVGFGRILPEHRESADIFGPPTIQCGLTFRMFTLPAGPIIYRWLPSGDGVVLGVSIPDVFYEARTATLGRIT